MNRFFVNKETYKERLDICRGCEHYFKPTGNCKFCGCFVRIKASMSVMGCPKEYWLATEEHETPKDGKIQVCYFSTPHRGLEVLLNAWEFMRDKLGTGKNAELNIYSSFKIYDRPH